MRNILRVLGVVLLIAIVVAAFDQGGVNRAAAAIAYIVGLVVIVALLVMTLRKLWRGYDRNTR